MKTLSAKLWKFFKPRWTKKQKKHRQLCRQEERELEQFILWSVEMSALNKKAQDRFNEQEAGDVRPMVEQELVEAVEALPDEFEGNADPRGCACCYTGCKGD